MPFSIVIPLYNKQHTITATLASVVSQDYEDFEIIVVNDGSTDNSLKEVESIKDKRIRVISTLNTGPSFARDIGALASHNDWVIFLDADDLMVPGALSIFDKHIKDSPLIDIFTGNFYLRCKGADKSYNGNYPDGVLVNPYKEWFFGRFMPCAGTCAFRRSRLIEHLYLCTLHRYEDAAMMLDIMHVARVYRFSTPVMIYNRDESSASAPRKDIKEDFLGRLSFEGKSRWEKLLLYQFYIEAKNTYPEASRQIYKGLEKKRFLLKLDYHLMNRIRHIRK